MRLVGIIGGLSWESTAEYYRLLNGEVALRLGGLSSARVVLSSVDFSWYAQRMKAGLWEEIGAALVEEGLRLARAGAEAIVIATNTMHLFAGEIEAAAGLPVLHIADAAGQAMVDAGLRRAGLLGTIFTMEKDFYRDRLRARFGIETIIPPPAERKAVDAIIFDELCRGIFRDESRLRLREIALGLAKEGAEGIILGCTELPLVMKDGDLPLAYLDTTRLHVKAAADFMVHTGPQKDA